jgi:hypothetical protein
MMFQGRSVISAVWGIVPSASPAQASRQLASQPAWSVLRLFRRQQRPDGLPRLAVSAPSAHQRKEPGL